MKKFSVLFTLLLFSIGITPVVCNADCFVVVKSNINIRKGPGLQFEVVKKLKLYDYQTNAKIEGNWISFPSGYLNFNSAKKLRGWKKVEQSYQKYKPGAETYLYTNLEYNSYEKGKIISYTGKVQGIYHEVIYNPQEPEIWYVHKSVVKVLNDYECFSYSLKCKEAAIKKKRINRIKKYGWSKKVEQAVLNGKIFIGMTKQQVIESWGKPDDINRTVGRWGVHEQWVYGNYGTYLYFEDGILTSWQD